MALEKNQHVERLRRFQPFQQDSAELIYEHADPNEKQYGMAALEYLQAAIELPSTRLVVLTGDAGHGKTSLCAQLLQSLGRTPNEAASAIRTLGDAATPIARSVGGRPLWLRSDLSDGSVEEGSGLLLRLLEMPEDDVAIVCANEGRLRAAVAQDASGTLALLTETLEQGLSDGSVTSPDGRVHVINLNFQSVAPQDGEGLIDWTLKTWAIDRRRWQVCGRCDAQDACPIYANHEELASGELGSTRVSAMRDLLSTAEKAGAVITTRQALALVSHAITGGLSCSDVHRRYSWSPSDTSWQFPHLFHQAIFADDLSSQQRNQVPPLKVIRSLDPGRVALRSVDDVLDPEDAASKFLPPVPSSDDGTPRSRRDARRESQMTRQLITFLRRRDFFDANVTDRTTRTGLTSGQYFATIANEETGNAVEVRDVLLRGLEAVQGVYRGRNVPDFLVLDPAFLANRSRAAVIARRIGAREATLVSQEQQWSEISGAGPTLPRAVDWVSRTVVLRISTDQGLVSIPLDLLKFELLFRWAAGLSSRIQHESEIRSLSGFLAALVPNGSPEHDIDVLVNGERRTLTIDVGEVIKSGGV